MNLTRHYGDALNSICQFITDSWMINKGTELALLCRCVRQVDKRHGNISYYSKYAITRFAMFVLTIQIPSGPTFRQPKHLLGSKILRATDPK